MVILNEILRQASDSDIIVNAHLINKGSMPNCDRPDTRKTDFYFIEKDEPEDGLGVNPASPHVAEKPSIYGHHERQETCRNYREQHGARNCGKEQRETAEANSCLTIGGDLSPLS